MAHQPSEIEQRIAWTTGFRCAADKAVLTAVVRWYDKRNDGTNVQPDIDELTIRSSIPKRTIERALQRLRGGGWIEATAHRHRTPTTYRIRLDRLATQDPEDPRLVVDNTNLDRHSGGQDHGFGGLDRHCGGQGELDRHSGGQGFGPNFDKVAVTDLNVRTPSQEDLVPGYTHTHSGADAPTVDAAAKTDDAIPETFRHPAHAYCGVWFCVPDFLDDEFAQQSGWSRANLQARYRGLNARVQQDQRRIGNALKFLRARFASWVAAEQPQQLTFGPLPPADPLTDEAPAADLWTRICNRLSTKMARNDRLTWFGPMRLHSIDRDDDGEILRVAAPAHHIVWVTRNHLAVLQDAVAEVRPGARIEFVAVEAAQQQTG